MRSENYTNLLVGRYELEEQFDSMSILQNNSCRFTSEALQPWVLSQIYSTKHVFPNVKGGLNLIMLVSFIISMPLLYPWVHLVLTVIIIVQRVQNWVSLVMTFFFRYPLLRRLLYHSAGKKASYPEGSSLIVPTWFIHVLLSVCMWCISELDHIHQVLVSNGNSQSETFKSDLTVKHFIDI